MNHSNSINIRDRLFDKDRCFVIAEAGVNHNGDLGIARRLVESAAAAVADAVKFQTFNADRLVSRQAPKARYQKETTGDSGTQFDMLKELELDQESYAELRQCCLDNDITFMSTPFDEESADLLAGLAMTIFKIASSEITNLPLLRHVARKKCPIILSTGMSGLGDVEAAVEAIEGEDNHDLVLLHCVSNYPAEPSDVNLRAMETLARAFGLPVGISDHTKGIEVSLAAVALGACVVEKHFTLDRNMGGPDHRASLEPDELSDLVRCVRNVEASLGHGRKQPTASEVDTARVARRSLVAAKDLDAGSVLTGDLVLLRRPGTGLPPSMLPYVIGRTLRKSVRSGTVLTMDLL